jgi:hypothetical protein
VLALLQLLGADQAPRPSNTEQGVRRLRHRTSKAHRIAGQIRPSENGIGGNDYKPGGAGFVPPRPDDAQGLLDELCDAINDDRLPPIVQAALVHAEFETIPRSPAARDARAARSATLSSRDAGWHRPT